MDPRTRRCLWDIVLCSVSEVKPNNKEVSDMTLSLYKTVSEETRSLVPTQISTGLLLRKLRLQPVSPSPGFPQHRPGDKQKYGEAHVGTICRSTAKK